MNARKHGRKEKMRNVRKSILMLLESIGTVPEELAERIREEKSPELLKEWLLAAARAGTVGEFSEQMHVRAEEVQA